MVKDKQSPAGDLPVLAFESQQAWAEWLDGQHALSGGIWLKIAKAGSGISSVTYAEALETALRYGWIDGQKRPLDASAWLQRFTPRGVKSNWSKVNREKAEALIASGQMRPAGLAAVERAKQDGGWERAYESQSRASVPEDLQAALDQHPEAKTFFDTLNRVNRYAILYRIQTVKRAETRARKIHEFIDMLERHETIYP